MKKLYYILFISTLLFSCEKPISDFQSENFIKLFGSGYKSKGNDVIELTNGGYLITGYDVVNNNDQMIYVAKVDENGNLVWQNTYGIGGNVNEGKVVKEVADGYLVAASSLKNGITYPIILKLGFNGEEVYIKELNTKDYTVEPMDIAIYNSFIYLAGYSDSTKTGHTDCYVSKLDLSSNLIADKPFLLASNSSFKKVFIKNDSLQLVGTNGYVNKLTVIKTNNNLGLKDTSLLGNSERLVDAAVSYMGMYTLSTSNTIKTKLTLLNDSDKAVWSYTNSELEAKSVTCRYDGSVIICTEKVDNGVSYIHFLKVSNGRLDNGDAYFKSFPGSVSKMIETRDRGYLLIGSTNDTYGINIQLIKTDKDYFMLKK